jgi:hypothetical protein
MPPLFKKRPPVTVHKFFCRKVLRHFYVPFVGSTEARKTRARRFGVVGPTRAK